MAAFAAPGESDMAAYTVDILAVGFFVLEWTVYAVTLEHSAYGLDSLSARMHVYREKWIRRLLDRETRMVDTQIMASLQNGTAFFASTSLLAVGAGLALLRSTNEALAVLGALPVDLSPSPALWEIKCVGFFFALGYLGWFVSPWVLFLTTAAVVIVTWRRQFIGHCWHFARATFPGRRWQRTLFFERTGQTIEQRYWQLAYVRSRRSQTVGRRFSGGARSYRPARC
jgi:uncharacterized membrane protein